MSFKDKIRSKIRGVLYAFGTGLRWKITSGLQLTMQTETETLVIMIPETELPSEWYAIGVCSPRSADSLDAVLANHAHHKMGPYPTLLEAVKGAVNYAMAWRLYDKSVVGAYIKCPCGDVECPVNTAKVDT